MESTDRCVYGGMWVTKKDTGFHRKHCLTILNQPDLLIGLLLA